MLFDDVEFDIHNVAKFTHRGEDMRILRPADVDAAQMDPTKIAASDQTATIELVATDKVRQALYPPYSLAYRILTPIGFRTKFFVAIRPDEYKYRIWAGNQYMHVDVVDEFDFAEKKVPSTVSDVYFAIRDILMAYDGEEHLRTVEVFEITQINLHAPLKIPKSLSMLKHSEAAEKLLTFQYGIPATTGPVSLSLAPCTYTLKRKDGSTRVLLRGVVREMVDSGDMISITISSNVEAEADKKWPEVYTRYPFTKQGIEKWFDILSDWNAPPSTVNRRFEPSFLTASRQGMYLGPEATKNANASRWGVSPFYFHKSGRNWYISSEANDIGAYQETLVTNYGLASQPAFTTGTAYKRLENPPNTWSSYKTALQRQEEEIGGFEGTRMYEFIDPNPAGLLPYHAVAFIGCDGDFKLPSWTVLKDKKYTGASDDWYLLLRTPNTEDTVIEEVTEKYDIYFHGHPYLDLLSYKDAGVLSTNTSYTLPILPRFYGYYGWGILLEYEKPSYYADNSNGMRREVPYNKHSARNWTFRHVLRNRSKGSSISAADYEPQWPTVISPKGIVRMPVVQSFFDAVLYPYFLSQTLGYFTDNLLANDHDVVLSDNTLVGGELSGLLSSIVRTLRDDGNLQAMGWHDSDKTTGWPQWRKGDVKLTPATESDIRKTIEGTLPIDPPISLDQGLFRNRIIPYEFWHDKTIKDTFFKQLYGQFAIVYAPASDGRLRPIWLGRDVINSDADCVIDTTNIRDRDHTIQHSHTLPIRSVEFEELPKRTSRPYPRPEDGYDFPFRKGIDHGESPPIVDPSNPTDSNDVSGDDREEVYGELDYPLWNDPDYWFGQQPLNELTLLSDYAEDLAAEGEDIKIKCEGYMARDSCEQGFGGNILGGHMAIAEECWSKAVENYGLPYPTVVLRIDERTECHVGDLVDITLPNMPAPDGTIGVRNLRGQVWERGDNIYEGTAEIEVLLVGWFKYGDV